MLPWVKHSEAHRWNLHHPLSRSLGLAHALQAHSGVPTEFRAAVCCIARCSRRSRPAASAGKQRATEPTLLQRIHSSWFHRLGILLADPVMCRSILELLTEVLINLLCCCFALSLNTPLSCDGRKASIWCKHVETAGSEPWLLGSTSSMSELAWTTVPDKE